MKYSLIKNIKSKITEEKGDGGFLQTVLLIALSGIVFALLVTFVRAFFPELTASVRDYIMNLLP